MLASHSCFCSFFTSHPYGTSHKKVSRVTQYVTLLNDYLFSTLRLMLSVHTHEYYEVRILYGIQYVREYGGPNDVSCLSREKEEELGLSTRNSDSRGMGHVRTDNCISRTTTRRRYRSVSLVLAIVKNCFHPYLLYG